MEEGGDVGDIGKRIMIWLGDRVKALVVTTGPKGIIFLFYEVERGGPGTRSLLTDSHSFHILEYLLAAARRSGTRHQYLEYTGGPVVVMKW